MDCWEDPSMINLLDYLNVLQHLQIKWQISLSFEKNKNSISIHSCKFLIKTKP